MSHRRRIIMKLLEQTNNLVDYFKTYKVPDIVHPTSPVHDIRWFGCRLKFQRKASYGSATNDVFSIANLHADASQKEYISIPTAMGYDSSKNYNLKIKAIQKLIFYNSTFKGSSFLTFEFTGINDTYSLINKCSQKISIEEIQNGTEFIIPIESGEYLNNLLIIYENPNGDSYTFTLLFEFYFEEITE